MANVPPVKENRLPHLQDLLAGCWEPNTEPSGEISLGTQDGQAFNQIVQHNKTKLEKAGFSDSRTQNGQGGFTVPVKDLMLAVRSLPSDAVVEVDA